MSEGTVGSRFVSESDLEAAKQRKQEEWKAAYARWVRCRPESKAKLRQLDN
jgi:hypothetical protein